MENGTSQESLSMTPRTSSESRRVDGASPFSRSAAPSPEQLVRLPKSTTQASNSTGSGSEDDLLVDHTAIGWEETWTEGNGDEGGSWNDIDGDNNDGDETDVSSHHHLSRAERRRVYGGGRHNDSDDDGSGLGVGEVAGMVLTATLTPTPLVLPHAAALLGLPIFIPLLFFTATLSWFTFVILGVESRYTGARSWPALASAVFPHRLKAHKLGEAFASLIVLFASLGRGIASLVAVTEVVVDLFFPAGGRRFWERVVGVSVIGALWASFPIAIQPLLQRIGLRRRPTNVTTLSRSPPYVALFAWPTALLILGVRLKQLNLDHPLNVPVSEAPVLIADVKDEAMGFSVWGGISIVVFALSAHQSTFEFLASLARIPSNASRTRSASDNVRESRNGTVEGRRNQWPFAALLGIGGATLIELGWGLVGYLGLDNGGQEGNLFASPRLPRADGWLALVRALVLVALLSGIELTLEPSHDRVRKTLSLVLGPDAKGTFEQRRRNAYSRLGPGTRDRNGPITLDPTTGKPRYDWRSTLSRVLVWACVIGASIAVSRIGEAGEGLASVAEIAGCIGATLLGFLGPAAFFVVLFHLRKPRSIFVTDPTDPAFAADQLLMRKEREVQRKLSGRRIWQDILTFGILLPYGLVVLIRGCVALVTKGE